MDSDTTQATPKKILCIEDEHFIGELYERALTKAGYDVDVQLDGQRGLAAVAASLHAMRVGGYVSAHDVKVAKALAFVMSGGDLTSPQWVTEQYLLDLEFEENAKLVLEPKTQERMMAILQTGKPLRN